MSCEYGDPRFWGPRVTKTIQIRGPRHAPWCLKNHGAGCFFGQFSSLGNVRHLSVPQQISFPGLILSKTTRPASNNRLHRVQYSSFPPEGVTGTSGYRFEYHLHLIKIPTHVDREASIERSYVIETAGIHQCNLGEVPGEILQMCPPDRTASSCNLTHCYKFYQPVASLRLSIHDALS